MGVSDAVGVPAVGGNVQIVPLHGAMAQHVPLDSDSGDTIPLFDGSDSSEDVQSFGSDSEALGSVSINLVGVPTGTS